MERTPVESSYIRSVGYDPTTHTLEIEFARGVVYQYTDVPQGIYQRLLSAHSHGRYYDRRIRGRFAASKVAGEGP